jgi:hypothetical protein
MVLASTCIGVSSGEACHGVLQRENVKEGDAVMERMIAKSRKAGGRVEEEEEAGALMTEVKSEEAVTWRE